MHREMLNHNHLFVDGSKITRDLGFTYKHPAVRVCHTAGVLGFARV